MYSASDIAKYVINKCTIDGCPISNLHLQKILYYLQKDYLQTVSKEGLFKDNIQAWKFGPVVSIVYYTYCGYGSFPIDNTYDVDIEPEDRDKMDAIIDKCKMKNPWELVDETHQKGRAWDLIFKDGEGEHEIIPNDLIAAKG